jgi:hypothetical protein
MTITDRNLKSGTKLTARYKGKTLSCSVVAGEAGVITYVLEDGRRFKTLSGAGSAAKGGKSCNGYDFWSVEGETSPTPAAHALNSRPPIPKPTRRRARGKKPTAEPQPEDGDYLIDGDGRPIPEGETSPGEESESSGQAT